MKLQSQSEFARFMSKAKLNPATGCWEWQRAKGGGRNGGYGHFGLRGKVVNAHQVAYETFIGPVPEGMVLDHLQCDNRGCMNPAHLALSTHGKNILRGNSLSARRKRQTHCARGHILSGDNLYEFRGGRHCRICRQIQLDKRKAKYHANPEYRERMRAKDRARKRKT